jgi:hypothetical protein
MKETDEFEVTLTKQEIDFVLNLIHNRAKPHTLLSFDLQTKLYRALGVTTTGLGRPQVCGKAGCKKQATGDPVWGSLTYYTCEDHRAEIEALVDNE